MHQEEYPSGRSYNFQGNQSHCSQRDPGLMGAGDLEILNFLGWKVGLSYDLGESPSAATGTFLECVGFYACVDPEDLGPSREQCFAWKQPATSP